MAGARKRFELDLSAFPAGAVTEYTTLVCLACIFQIFTRQMHLAPRTAYSEVKRYAPSVAELTAPRAARPFFDSDEPKAHCPYCAAASRWHARLDTYRIEGGKTTDVARRSLIKQLPKKDDQFLVIETRSDRRTIFFDWLDTLRVKLDLDSEAWLTEATQAFLERRVPKTDWEPLFADVRAVRRSDRLAAGAERDGARLFLAPDLYHEALLVQYLISRSHQHGGRTLEGRLTLPELLRRFRHGDYFQQQKIADGDQFELLEQLLDRLAGSGAVTLYHIVDRREFLERVKSTYARYAA